MPFDLDWLDQDRLILALRLYDPLHDEDIEGLRQEIQPLVDQDKPVYVLLDIREFNPLQALSAIGGQDGIPLPRLDGDQARHSRVAIMGQGAMVKMLLMMAGDDDDEHFQAFEHEDQAYTWLSEQSRAASDSSGAGFG